MRAAVVSELVVLEDSDVATGAASELEVELGAEYAGADGAEVEVGTAAASLLELGVEYAGAEKAGADEEVAGTASAWLLLELGAGIE